jgi:zinc protease
MMRCRRLIALLIALSLSRLVRAADQSIPFTSETLENGLKVLYVPLHQAPVVHARVLYHVGSRDERPDRQGFAHMFEHMMFRGSAHVKPEEHMKLIDMVGGISNAFTSFDETVYVNTIPANHLEMALYLEADRMASFKVSEDIYKTERKVVAEEWRMGQNRPYGTMFEDFLKNAFIAHSYRWTPIGKMEHLQAAAVNELQDFFNTYYVPNNAILVIAGDFQEEQARAMVKKYFGWIPAGRPVVRQIPAEPEQTEMRKAVTPQRVPLPAIMIGYKTPQYRSDDHYPLQLLGTILGDGRSSRLHRLLVDSEKPLCISVSANDETLEDAGVFVLSARVMQGRNPDEVTKVLLDAVADVRDKGVSEEELKKAKTQVKVALEHGRETAEKLASQVGEEALFGGDANRVNTQLAKIEAVTTADIKAMAEKYLQPQRATDLLVKPDPLGKEARAAATQAEATANAPVTVSKPIEPRAVTFPPGYPQTPPMAKAAATPEFKKGTELNVNGVKVVVMTDDRLPLVNWRLTMRRGSYSEPKEKKGIASLCSEMLRHGTTVLTYEQLNEDLESRGISIGIGNGGDITNLIGSCTSDQLDHGVQRSREILLTPRWDAAEFARVKDQQINRLLQAQEQPGVVAAEDLDEALYPGSVFAYRATPTSVAGITLEDVKQFYATYFKPNDAVLLMAGDVTVEKGKELAEKLLADWKAGGGELPAVVYSLKPVSGKRRIILVDRPEAKGVTIRMAIRAYDLHNDDKYAGSLAGQVLTGSGIESRLMKYVRAEKGLVYGITGYFRATRRNGVFQVSTETRPEAAEETILAAFHVFEGMRGADVTEAELSEAKLRVAGSMVMGMQTIEEQASTRMEGILNDYPIDYYDKYPARLAEVNADQVRAVMNKYVNPDAMTIVVVAPAELVKPALEKLGEVEVRAMPAARGGSTTKPATTREMLKPAA